MAAARISSNQFALLGLPGLLFALRAGYLTFDTAMAVTIAGFAAFIVYRLQTFIYLANRTKHIPGEKFLLGPLSSLPSLLLPEIRFINSGLTGGNAIDAEKHRQKTYEHYGTTITSIQGAFPPLIYLQVSDTITIQHIYAHNNDFPKNTDIYMAIKKFGLSLIITEGADFRRHRRIIASAFAGDAQNALDWQESTKVTHAWMKELDRQRQASGKAYIDEHVLERCLGLALYVISTTAFGVPAAMPGQPTEETRAGFKYSFARTLHLTLENIFILIAAPDVLKGWFPSKEIQAAFVYKEEMDRWMNTIVEERRAQAKLEDSTRNDLLSLIVKSNDAHEAQTYPENSKAPLSKQILNHQETIANIWLFLLAGCAIQRKIAIAATKCRIHSHETSSHTLTYCLGLLAIYPEEQERLHQEISEICPDPEAEIPFSLYGQFLRAQAIINESLRLYPVVLGIPKEVRSDEDAVVPTSERGPLKGEPILIPKGTKILVDVLGVHHDRKKLSP